MFTGFGQRNVSSWGQMRAEFSVIRLFCIQSFVIIDYAKLSAFSDSRPTCIIAGVLKEYWYKQDSFATSVTGQCKFP